MPIALGTKNVNIPFIKAFLGEDLVYQKSPKQGVFLLYNTSNKAYYRSIDGGKHWDTIDNTPADNTATIETTENICFGNGKFVTTPEQYYFDIDEETGNGIIMDIRSCNSTDGIHWEPSETDLSLLYNAGGYQRVCYGGGQYILVSDTYNATSPDGVVWTISSLQESAGGVKGNGYRIVYGNNTFVTIGGGAHGTSTTAGAAWIHYSKNGYFWKKATGHSTSGILSYGFNDVAFGNGVFVAVGNRYAICTSTDGVNWTNKHSAGNFNIKKITFGNGKFVAFGHYYDTYASKKKIILTSVDGATWTETVVTDLANISEDVDLGFGGGTFIMANEVDTSIYTRYSTDGISWSAPTLIRTDSLNQTHMGNGDIVLVYGEITVKEEEI